MSRQLLYLGAFALICLSLLFVAGSGGQVKESVKEPVKEKLRDALPPLPMTMLAKVGFVTDINASLPAGAVKFTWLLAKSADVDWRTSGTTGFFLARKAGTYTVFLSWIEGAEIKQAQCDINAQDIDVVPPDPVKVDPTKPEKPVAMWIVVVDQPGASAWMPAFTTNSALTTRMGQIGHKFRFVDRSGKDEKGNIMADLAKFVQDSQVRPLPWVYLVNPETQSRRWEGPLPVGPKGPDDPQGPAGLLAKIMEAGG